MCGAGLSFDLVDDRAMAAVTIRRERQVDTRTIPMAIPSAKGVMNLPILEGE